MKYPVFIGCNNLSTAVYLLIISRNVLLNLQIILNLGRVKLNVVVLLIHRQNKNCYECEKETL